MSTFEDNRHHPSSSGFGPKLPEVRSLSEELPYSITFSRVSDDFIDQVFDLLMPEMRVCAKGYLAELLRSRRAIQSDSLQEAAFVQDSYTVHQRSIFRVGAGSFSHELCEIGIERARDKDDVDVIYLSASSGSSSDIDVSIIHRISDDAEMWPWMDGVAEALGVLDLSNRFATTPREKTRRDALRFETTLAEGVEVATYAATETQAIVASGEHSSYVTLGTAIFDPGALEICAPSYEDLRTVLNQVSELASLDLIGCGVARRADSFTCTQNGYEIERLRAQSSKLDEPIRLEFGRVVKLTPMGDGLREADAPSAESQVTLSALHSGAEQRSIVFRSQSSRVRDHLGDTRSFPADQPTVGISFTPHTPPSRESLRQRWNLIESVALAVGSRITRDTASMFIHEVYGDLPEAHRPPAEFDYVDGRIQVRFLGR